MLEILWFGSGTLFYKKTDVKLDLLTDVDMHLFIEQGIRGGVAMIDHRYLFRFFFSFIKSRIMFPVANLCN